MSPSRGSKSATAVQTNSETSLETAADASSSTALRSLKTNLHYLLDPSGSSPHAPARFRTRALLRSLHYLSVFIFWRVVRYAKYAVVGSIVAALSATAVGSMVTPVGWILAPTGIVGSLGMGLIYWAGKTAFRKMGVGERVVERSEVNARKDEGEVRTDGGWRGVQGPRAVPW